MTLNRNLLNRVSAALAKAAGVKQAYTEKDERKPLYRDTPEYMGREEKQTPASIEGNMSSEQELERARELVRKADLKKQQEEMARRSEQTPFGAGERLQFARMGLNPDRLRFISSLSALRKGMNLESELLDRALRGKISTFGNEPEDLLGGMPLGQFA